MENRGLQHTIFTLFCKLRYNLLKEWISMIPKKKSRHNWHTSVPGGPHDYQYSYIPWNEHIKSKLISITTVTELSWVLLKFTLSNFQICNTALAIVSYPVHYIPTIYNCKFVSFAPFTHFTHPHPCPPSICSPWTCGLLFFPWVFSYCFK